MQVLETDSHGNYTEYVTDTFYGNNVHVWVEYNYDSVPVDACVTLIRYEDGHFYGPFIPPWQHAAPVDRGTLYQECLKTVCEQYPSDIFGANEVIAECDTETIIQCNKYTSLLKKGLSYKSLSEEDMRALELHIYNMVVGNGHKRDE